MENTTTEKKVIKILKPIRHKSFDKFDLKKFAELEQCTSKLFIQRFDSILSYYGWIIGIETSIQLNKLYRLLKKELAFRETGVLFT